MAKAYHQETKSRYQSYGNPGISPIKLNQQGSGASSAHQNPIMFLLQEKTEKFIE